MCGLNAADLWFSETLLEFYFVHPSSIGLMVIDFDKIYIVRLRAGQSTSKASLLPVISSLREGGVRYFKYYTNGAVCSGSICLK